MLNVASAAFAILAAVFWFVSARVHMPGLTYQGPADNPFHLAMRKAAWWNVAASTCAGISAFLQAVAALRT